MSRDVKHVVLQENNRRFEVVTKDQAADFVHIDSAKFAHLRSRCDYAVRVSMARPGYFFFVELKGNDVGKAAKQLVCSIESLEPLYSAYAQREAWVVAGGWTPAVSTNFQVQKAKAKKYGFVLKYKTRSVSIAV